MSQVVKHMPHSWIAQPNLRAQYDCSKMSFESKGEALVCCRGINGDLPSRKSKRQFVYPYHCTTCKKWHITSQGKSKRAKY